MLVRILLLFICHVAETGRAPTWDHCGCRWAEWRAWSVCSASCGKGQRFRSRAVWNHNYPECTGFSVCATDDMAFDIGLCNTICYHGSYAGGHCLCQPGWYGRCCNKEINCGNPGILKDGSIETSSFTYNSEIIYHCNELYNLTGGTKTRRCLANATWSGQKPKCAFINSCQSNPCMNQGTCINGIDDYKCVCTRGFHGSNCQIKPFSQIQRIPPSFGCKRDYCRKCVLLTPKESNQQ